MKKLVNIDNQLAKIRATVAALVSLGTEPANAATAIKGLHAMIESLLQVVDTYAKDVKRLNVANVILEEDLQESLGIIDTFDSHSMSDIVMERLFRKLIRHLEPSGD